MPTIVSGLLKYKRKKKAKGQFDSDKIKYPTSYRRMAKSAYKMSKQLKMSREIKYIDYSLPNTTLTTTAVSYSLGDLSQGITGINRIGRYVNFHSLKCHIVTGVTSNASPSVCIRIAIILYRGDTNSGTFPAWSNIFYTGDGTTNSYLSFYNDRYLDDFKVLYDQIFSLGIGGMPATRVDDYKIPLNFKAAYNDATTYMTNGALYLFAITNVTANLPGILYRIRLTFSDA